MKKQEISQLNREEIFAKLQTFEIGLSQSEARGRLRRYGKNILTKAAMPGLTILVRQVKSSFTYLLVVAGIISFALRNYSDGIIIATIFIINASLSFFQEYRSEKMIEKLSKLISKQILAKRDGKVTLIDEADIVPGDILIVREGDIVPADMRLLEADNLQVNESQLTGESVPVVKRAVEKLSHQPEKPDDFFVFSGSTIEKGQGVGVVYATGDDTELGAIASLSAHTKKITHYEKSLQSFSEFLMRIVFAGLALIFFLKLILTGNNANISLLLLYVVALAIAVVPEALPVIATITMSRGSLKLAKQHVVVKRLSSLEDLGNINLLCTDKTGTITENKIVITKIVSVDDLLFQKFAIASIGPIRLKHKKVYNAYNEAFLKFIPKTIQDQAQSLKIVKELPFDPEDRRSRAVLRDDSTKKYYLVVMGSPETILEISRSDKKDFYLKDLANEGRQGLRHLAIAYKEVFWVDNFDIIQNEKESTFLGYVAMRDPLRSGAKHSIALAQKLGITIKILTGDSKEVAEYVGSQVNLLKAGDKVYVGDDLEKMSREEFQAAVVRGNVFARVSPTQKYAIIQALKVHNVVAYQGDGINDAPALKLADVAIAVEGATDVAKENADIVLLQKNLEVIIRGIQYGRSIFVNITKYIKYTMVGNFGNFFALAILYLISSNLPLLPTQVLLVSLITDIPLISISSDSVALEEVSKPEKSNVKELISLSLLLGFPTALFELAYFGLLQYRPEAFTRTSLFIFLAFLQLIVFFSVRNKDFFWKGKKPSILLAVSFLAAFMVSMFVTFISPFQQWFHFISLPAYEVLMMIVLMVIYFFILDTTKMWYYRGLTSGR